MGIGTYKHSQVRDGGFTLVELTIAVFVMAVLMTIAVPHFVRSFNESQLGATARKFATACQLARMQAVMQQKPCIVHFDMEGQRFRVEQVRRTTEGDEQSDVQLDASLGSRVRIVSVQIGEEAPQTRGEVSATFYPNGTCDPVMVTFGGTTKEGTVVLIDPVTARPETYPTTL